MKTITAFRNWISWIILTIKLGNPGFTFKTKNKYWVVALKQISYQWRNNYPYPEGDIRNGYIYYIYNNL